MMTQLIEIPVPAVTQRQQLPDIQQLRSQEGQQIIVKGLSLVTPKVLTNSMTIAGTNATLAELRKMTLVLYSLGWERGQMIPLLFLNAMADGDGTTATTIPYAQSNFQFDNWAQVDWPKSYLLYANGQQAAGTPYTVMLNVSYVKLDSQNQPIVTAR